MDIISEQRIKDITKAYYDGIKSIGKSSVSNEDVIRSVIAKGAPRFYVSPEKAKRYISILNRGEIPKLSNPHKIEMYFEIFRRYRIYVERYGIKGYSIIDDIIKEPAPSYYISISRFREIIYSQLKSKHK